MFHYTPASTRYPDLASKDAFYRPAPQPLNPRERYLAAVAEAKAAEAAYLAAEATQREEEALRARLQEIQQQRQQQQQASLPYGYSSPIYAPPSHAYSPTSYPAGYASLSLETPFPAGQLASGGFLPITDLRSHLELEEHRRAQEIRHKQEAEKARFLVLKERKEAEERKIRLRQQEESRCLAVLREREVEAHRQASLRRSRCAAVNQPINEAQSLLELLFQSPESAVGKPYSKKAANSQPSRNVETNQEAKPKREVPSQVPALQFLELLFGAPQHSEGAKPDQLPKAPSSSNSHVAHDSTKATDGVQQLLNLFVGGAAPNASTKPSQSDGQQSHSKTPEPTSSARTGVETSLKEALQSRLNNEYATEIRDTIQAIFASLADPEPTPAAAPAAQTNAAASSSGKGKAKETIPVVRVTEPTSKDVLSSMDQVRNIETAFHMLESDFTFPSQLDFTASFTAPSTPAGSDSESSVSPTSRLAYTSRNHPLRFYEQALSALLSQLDSVESFGNETLRGRRKEVVGQVEKALEELEQEVEGRWRVKVAKEIKTFKVEVTDPVKELVVVTDTKADEPSAPLATTAGSSTSTSQETEREEGASAEIPVTGEPAEINHVDPPAASTVFPAEPSDVTIHTTSEEIEGASIDIPTITSTTSDSSTTDANVALSTENSTSQRDSDTEADILASVELADAPSLPEPVLQDEESIALPDTNSLESSSIANSETTIRPYSGGNDSDSNDTFLMSKLSPYGEPENKKAGADDTDVGSDWSEVEA